MTCISFRYGVQSTSGSRKPKNDMDEKMGFGLSQSSVKSSKTPTNGGPVSYSQFNGGYNSSGGGGGVAKIYGGGGGGQYQPPPQQHHQQQVYHQQQQQQGYPNPYATPAGSLSSATSATSKRLTFGGGGGDLGPSSYQHGSRKNAASMYVTGSGVHDY